MKITVFLATLPTEGPAHLKAMATVIVALAVLATLLYYLWKKIFHPKKIKQ